MVWGVLFLFCFSFSFLTRFLDDDIVMIMGGWMNGWMDERMKASLGRNEG